ncbi:MAG TPA: energy transducer TonB [Pyrinomonadaceae bacterium]|nr:energy transducer TonB [Pyrinomonadaceae bacterium]
MRSALKFLAVAVFTVVSAGVLYRACTPGPPVDTNKETVVSQKIEPKSSTSAPASAVDSTDQAANGNQSFANKQSTANAPEGREPFAERRIPDTIVSSSPPAYRPSATPYGSASGVEGVSTAQGSARHPRLVSRGVLNGKAVSLPKPEYPPIARNARVSGPVTVEIVIDESGNVISANAVSGHPMLRQSAVNAARQAKFSPTILAGRPTRVTGVITYNFTAQ